MMHTVDESVTKNRCVRILAAIREHAELERDHRAEQE